jgi:hypothetical protein
MATPEPRPGPTRQGPVRSEQLVDPGEHHPGRVVGQRPERLAQCPPHRLGWPARDEVQHLVLVEPQPDKRVSRGRQVLQCPAALADHADCLVLGSEQSLNDAEQFGGPCASGNPERDQRTVPVGGQPGEQLAERLVRDAPRRRLGLLRLVGGPPRWLPEELHRVVVGIQTPVLSAFSLGKRVDQRTAVHLPVVLIERPDRCASMAPGPRRVVSPGWRLASKRVHGAGGRGIRPARPGGLLDSLEPQGEVTGLGPACDVPADLDRVQEAEPAQQLVGIRPQRGRPGIVSQHVVQELGDRRHLGTMLVEQHERP